MLASLLKNGEANKRSEEGKRKKGKRKKGKRGDEEEKNPTAKNDCNHSIVSSIKDTSSGRASNTREDKKEKKDNKTRKGFDTRTRERKRKRELVILGTIRSKKD